VLLAQEAVKIVGVEVGGQHFDRDRAVQQRLSASIHNAKAAASDLGDIVKSRVAQFRGNVWDELPLCRMRIDVGHRRVTILSRGRLTSVTNDTISLTLPTEDAIDLGNGAPCLDRLQLLT
jgi:predicted urease superfamily metal-dependent hydrolase